jgi:hypothetical protein
MFFYNVSFKIQNKKLKSRSIILAYSPLKKFMILIENLKITCLAFKIIKIIRVMIILKRKKTKLKNIVKHK